MSAWDALLPPALVGTDSHAGTWPPSGAWPAEVATLIGQTAADPSRATALLRMAAVLSVVQSAAEFGRPWADPLPVAAPDEVLPSAPPEPSHAWVLHEGPPRVQHELLATMASRGQRLPESWLPAALELGRRSTALRAPVTAVLGARGVWLAAQRDDWRWAVGSNATDDAELWADGSLEQRANLLRRERGAAPDAARERLAATLPELPANERVELIAALATGLSASDEPLLETLLQDRSREVRQTASLLLLRLPQSAFVARAIARVTPLLSQERALIRQRWVIEPPPVAEPTDIPRPKNDTLGDRAWWLYQAVRQVPLSWWNEHTGLRPGELLTWAEETDWAEALHRAWRDVLFAAPEPAWCEAFVRVWPRGAGRDERAAVLSLLPLNDREAHWLRELEHNRSLSDDLLVQLPPGCPAPQHLSLLLSRELAAALRARLAQGPLAADAPLRLALIDMAGLLHPQALDSLRDLPQRDDDPPSVVDLLHTVQRIVTARTSFSP